MAREEMKFSQLFAGEVGHIVRVPVSGATLKRGDIIEGKVTSGAVATAFTKATAVTVGNIYVVCAENVENYTGEVIGYADGCFDFEQVKINDAEATDAHKLALMASKIYLLHTN